MLTLKKRFPSLQSLGSDGNTSFLRAARAGNLEKVLEHLKNNIDINTSNANGLNALHLASKDGHVAVVSELLARGATVDAATKKGNTALHIASLAGQEEVVKLLIQNNASVNVQSQNGFTPLYMAAQENHDSVVRLLLSNGANQSLATEDGFTPLAVAMQQGHDKVVAVLLESDTRGKVRLPALHIAAKKDDVKAATLLLENDHNPDVTSKSGFTPLHIASHYGNEAMANLLIQKGADVNYAAKHNISPLHVAAKWGKTNMVALLLEKGASIESKTRDGLTPLHCAARSGHEQVVDMLLERGAPISAKTKNGLAPLHMAAQGEHVDAARILLYHRAPVDEVTVDYLTALHVAAHCGHVRVAKLLLDRNADANARALNGFTPLHIACKKNRIKVVELLLKHGASISATTESGLTPLHVASFMGCMNIVIYLLQHDASPDVPTVRGETPLHLAARANQTDIIRILLRNGAQVDARAREQQTPLHIASRLGNVDIVMLLLQHGAQVDAVTKDMYTALHIAAKEGQDEVAGTLLENGAQIDASTKKGFTPLHLTAKYGHIKVAELLLTKNAPVDAQGKNGVTPLHVASHYDNQNVALLLLEKGASPHATAKNGHTPLHIAARKNQMSIATTLLQYGANANAESKAGFTPLHLSSQEGHHEMSALMLENKANPDHQARNGLTPLHLCAQEDRVNVAQVLVKHGADTQAATKAGYTPLHVASHFGQANMVRYLIQQGVDINAPTGIGYTPLHQASQQGHCHIVNILLENNADPNAITNSGQTSLKIAQKLGYISVLDSLKSVTDKETASELPPSEEKYRVVAPEAMHETFMSDSEEEGGEDTVLSDQPYRYLTVDEMKSLGDDSLPIDVTRDERHDSNRMTQSTDSHQFPPTAMEDSISPQHMSMVQSGISVTDFADNINIERQSHIGKLHWKNFLVSFLVDARGGAMRGCRHSGVRIIVPPRSAAQPTRITCRYVKPQRTLHPPPLMEGEALASRVLELGPVGAKFLGPVIMEVPHFASLRGKEREIVILRSDNGETWREHNIDMSDEIIHDVLNDCFEPEDLAQLDELGGGRICRYVTYDFPQYFAVISRIRQEVHAIGPEGGMVSSTVVPQVQAVFPQGALTKKIKVGLQAQPIDPDLTAKMLGRGVAVSPVVTVEPRRRKFHKAITLSMPAPRAHSQGMINQYSGNAPTLRLLCSITGGTTRAQWEDVTGSTPLTFVNDCVSFTTTVSARFWLMDCRNIADATKMATELYKEAIHVPFMAKFVVFAKRTDPLEARLRVFCMTDDREDKTLEHQEHFTEVAKSRDVEVLEDKQQYIELAGNLVPITKSGEQLSLPFKAFRENRLPFAVRVKDQHADIVGRTLFMREPKIAKGEPPQQPICILNIVLPETIIPDHTTTIEDSQEIVVRVGRASRTSPRDQNYLGELRVVDISNLLGEDWVKLAPEIGISETDVENIIAQNPTSSAQQAQAMLKQFQSKAKNDFNILENGLRTIHRDDIVERCLRSSATTTTTTVTMRNKTAFSISKRSHDVDIIAESESIAKLVQKEDNQYAKEESSKYSVEEKRVEESEESEEETIKKTVAERRKQIEKRLSADRSIPASTQKREIVEEIITIKRSSVIDDTRAKHEEEILMQKPIDNTYKSSVIPEPVVKLKTTHLKDGSSVPKDEFDKELQDKFKSTLKNVDEFEHKSQVLDVTEKVDTSAKIVDEIAKKDVPEFKPKMDEPKPKDDKKKPDDDAGDGEGKPPVAKERAPVPTKRTSVSLEDDTSESGVVSESIKNVQDKISSFETKSSDSSKRTSWAKDSSMGSKQWSEEQEILVQKAQLEAADVKWTEEDEIRAEQKEFFKIAEEQAKLQQQQLESKKEQWSEEQEILAQKAQLEAADVKWTEAEEVRAQHKKLDQISEEQSKQQLKSKKEQWSEEQEILAQKAQFEAAEATRVQWTEEDEIRNQQKEFKQAIEEQSKQQQKKIEVEIKPAEVKEEIMIQKAQLEEMEHDVEVKLGKWAQEEIHEMEAYKHKIEHIAEEQIKHQKELIEEKFEKMEEEFLTKVAEEKKELFDQFEQKLHAQEHALTLGFQDMKSEGQTKMETMEQQFQQTKSEVFSKVEEKVTSKTSKAESFAEGFKTEAKKIEGLGEGFRQEVQEFTAQSSETKTFVDQKVDRTVKEIRDSEVVSEVKESTQQSKQAVDRAAEAVAKETVTSSEHVQPAVQEAFTKESFASVREEVISKDLAGTLKESAEKTKTEVETGIRQGDELIAEKVSEIGEEFRRTEETVAIKPDEKPSIVETVKKTVTQEVTSKIPVLSKRTSPEEPTKPKEVPKLEKDAEPPMESIIEAAHTVVKHVEAAVSKIPRFHESTKPTAHKPETSDIKSPEPEVTFSKIPILRDRKSSEQFSSDSCETVIIQKTLREQDSLLKSDSDEKPAEALPATVREECEEITSKEVKEVLSFTTIDESVLNELITEDERAVTPDDFIDEIIEEAQDKVQMMQDTEIAAYTLDLSKSEDDVQQKSPHPIPEYVTERYGHADEYDDHDEHEKWQGEEYLNLVQSEASNLVDSILEQSVSIVNNSQLQQDVAIETQAHSESEQYAIRSDILSSNEADHVVKSPTIESMSGKSFDDNISNPDYDSSEANQQLAQLAGVLPTASVGEATDGALQPTGTDEDGPVGEGGAIVDEAARKERRANKIERHFERLSSEIEPEALLDKNRDYDEAIAQIKDEVSMLQSEFSKMSWDESLSATTGDFGSSTPDHDLQETDTQPQTEITIPKPTPRSQSNLTADADASAATTSVATTTTATTTTSSAAAVASSLTTPSALATKPTDEASTVETTDHDKPAISGDASEFSSSQEPLPVPRPRTSISSRTDTQTRSSIIESFDQPEDSIEQYPEPGSQRQESVASEDFSGTAQKDSVEFETSDEDLPATKFYIGERSSDVITRSSSEKRSDYAFDNIGYEYSQDSGADEEPQQDPCKVYREKIFKEDSFTLEQLQEVETGTSLDEEIKAEVIEIIEGIADQSKSFELDLEKPIDAPRQPVVHSPMQPQVAKIVDSAKPSTQKPTEIDEPSQPEVIKRTIDELAIEKTLEEVKESLDAVHEELIESVVDGKLIKQSPSEFEFKVLPSTKYSQDPIYEAQQEEVMASSAPTATADLVEPVTTTTIISEPIILTETKTDSFEQKTSDPESKETSYESARPDGPTPISSDSSFAKLDVSPRMRKAPHHPKGTRWSATDIDSSGESQYQSFEQTDSSRPQSSDVDKLMQYASSEYETAMDNSIVPPSTEYHSAASTLNSFSVSTHDSLKSFDSESSGNLASMESEATETLVPSTMDIDFDSSDAAALIHDDSEDDLRDKLLLDDKEDLSSTSGAIPVVMKRSQEMHFTVDLMDVQQDSHGVFQLQEDVEERLAQEQSEKLSSSIGNALDLMDSMKASSLEDVKTECIDDIRLGTSLEDGSILSISLSSASNLETIMENLPDKGAESLPTHMEIGLDAITPIVGTSADIIGDITLTSTVVREGDVNFLNTQATTEMAGAKEVADENSKKRGHKRTESTISGQLMSEITAEARDSLDSQEESVSLEASKQSSVERDETREESSDSDYDRYESEYSRSFRAPLIQSQKKKKDKVNEGYEMEVEHDRRNSFSPSSSVIETIVEDVHAEIEQEDEAQQLMEIKKEQLQEYQQTSATSIPDIQVTDDVQMEELEEEPAGASYSAKPMERETSDHKIQYAVQEEFKISEEQYQEMIDQKYKSKMADITTKFDFEADDKEDSAGSDSFEMLEQPDISDEFVIVEEVAREAHECDMEGKSVSIQQVKMERKHDEEVEKMLVKSAPAHTNAGSLYANMREDMMYAFEDSPPTGSEEVDPNAVTMDLLNNGYPLEESKRWVEMQLAETQNYRYPYDERLEDIKEEDEVGSSRIGSIKDSFSSTPDYDMLAKRLASRGGEHDDISMSSLQEFESLEQVISLENRKMQQGSQDSLSNGSFTKRFLARGGHGDDISLSSLKEFEGLETACLEAHLIEIKAKEEAALLLSRSDESNKSDRSTGAKKSPPTNGTVVRATTSSTTVTSGPEQQATKVETRVVTTQMNKDSLSTTTTATTVTTVSHGSQIRHALEEEDTSHLLTVSSDSLDGNRIQQQTISKDTLPSAHSSSDSLEINNKNNLDLMTSSIDSIEFSRAGAMTTRSSRSDSIEQMALQQPQRSDSTDSIEMQHAVMSRASETKRDSLESLPYSIENKSTSSSPTKPAAGQRMTTENVMIAGSSTLGYPQTGMTKDISIDSLTGQDAFLTSTESLETSSTATNATYQNETDSQMSSSVTSCGSITMVDTLDNLGDLEGFGLQESMTFQSSSTTTMVTASTSSSGQQQQQQQQLQHQQQQQHSTTQVLRSSTSSTSTTTSTTASTRSEFPLAEIELLSRQLYPGDLTFDDAKESAKEKLQSKTTEKED